jgi:hypothetical protein
LGTQRFGGSAREQQEGQGDESGGSLHGPFLTREIHAVTEMADDLRDLVREDESEGPAHADSSGPAVAEPSTLTGVP